MEAKVAAQASRLVDSPTAIFRCARAHGRRYPNRLLEESGYLRWAGFARSAVEPARAAEPAQGLHRCRASSVTLLAGIGDFVRHLDQVIDADLAVGEAAEEVRARGGFPADHPRARPRVPGGVPRQPASRPRDTRGSLLDPTHGFVMKNWRGEAPAPVW
jgi:hypothetical protein